MGIGFSLQSLPALVKKHELELYRSFEAESVPVWSWNFFSLTTGLSQKQKLPKDVCKLARYATSVLLYELIYSSAFFSFLVKHFWLMHATNFRKIKGGNETDDETAGYNTQGYITLM